MFQQAANLILQANIDLNNCPLAPADRQLILGVLDMISLVITAAVLVLLIFLIEKTKFM